jgi:pimeloyl-ACP methyl ester carboxylesterase
MFSRKEPLNDGCSIWDRAKDQAEALAALGLKRVSVLGVSEGGMIAQCLAMDYPELVEKLVLAVTAPCVNDVILSCVPNWMDMAKRGDHKALMIDTAEHSYSPAHLQKYRKMYPLLSFVGRPKTYDRFLANARAILSFDATAELPKIACSTLILGGEEDRIVGPEASRAMADLIPNSTLHLYPGLGHAAYEEAKDFNERVFGFLNDAH